MDERIRIIISLEGQDELYRILNDMLRQIERLRSGAGNVNFRQANQSALSFSKTLDSLFRSLTRIGTAFQTISQFGFGRFVSSLENSILGSVTGSFTSQFDNAVERFDVMKTFPLLLEQIGIPAKASAAAIDKLNQAVLGLPTSLTEIMSLTQRFASVMKGLGIGGEDLIDTASDFAIAVNNAFLAAGATSEQSLYGIRQFIDLIAKGDLRTQEWDGLTADLGVAATIFAEKFGYKDFRALREAITEGNLSLQEFIAGVIELGTADGPLAQMANITKKKLASVFTNIGNAFQRLIAGRIVEDDSALGYHVEGGILGTLDKIIGERYIDDTEINDLASYIKNKLIPRIDEMAHVFENWATEHSDDIFNFLDRLFGYDWEGLVSTIGRFLAFKWDMFLNVLEKIDPKILAFTSVLAGPIGSLLLTIGLVGRGAVDLFGSLGSGMSSLWGAITGGGIVAEGAEAGAAGLGTGPIGLITGLLIALGIAGNKAYEQWNGATEAAETYYLTVDKLERDNELNPENLAKLRSEADALLAETKAEYEAYLEDYKIRYDLYTSQGGTESFEEWLPFWARWKSNDYEQAIALYENTLVRIDNMNFMHTDSWKIYKAEADKIGGIPEELQKAFEEGTIAIPTTLDEFLALIVEFDGNVETEVTSSTERTIGLAKKKVDGGLSDIDTSLDGFDQSIRENRVGQWSELGALLGDALGGTIFGRALEWLNSIIALFDIDYSKFVPEGYGAYVPSAKGSNEGRTGHPGEMRKKFSAYGGAIHFGNWTNGNYHDTIPAMLSPGEYVLRKYAVDKIGLDFLNKLNNFNFTGALDSLTKQVGSGLSPYSYAGAPSNNTRIYNNNAQAHITVNNSSQEFTQRRASKWIRGLN